MSIKSDDDVVWITSVKKKKTQKKEQTSQIKVGHFKIIKAFSSFRLEGFFFFFFKNAISLLIHSLMGLAHRLAS